MLRKSVRNPRRFSWTSFFSNTNFSGIEKKRGRSLRRFQEFEQSFRKNRIRHSRERTLQTFAKLVTFRKKMHFPSDTCIIGATNEYPNAPEAGAAEVSSPQLAPRLQRLLAAADNGDEPRAVVCALYFKKMSVLRDLRKLIYEISTI